MGKLEWEAKYITAGTVALLMRKCFLLIWAGHSKMLVLVLFSLVC
jgi:hypothetical protein